jgi:hypothetical protein
MFDLSQRVFSKYTIFNDQNCTLININVVKQVIYFGTEDTIKECL